MTRTYTGLIAKHSDGEHVALFLSDHEEPIADELSWIRRKNVTVRYWITDVKCSKNEAITAVLHTLDGYGDAKYSAHYSELTGYLWTDEWLKVGGHDLLAELNSNVGKWVILEVEIEVTDDKS